MDYYMTLLEEHDGTVFCTAPNTVHTEHQIAYMLYRDSVVGEQFMCLNCWLRFTKTLVEQRMTAYADLEAANKEISDQLQVITEMKWELLPPGPEEGPNDF